MSRLHQAIVLDDIIAVAQCLREGDLVDELNTHGETALMVAAQRGDPAIVVLLLQHGASLIATNPLGQRAIQMAVRHGHAALVPIMSSWGCNQSLASRPAQHAPDPTKRLFDLPADWDNGKIVYIRRILGNKRSLGAECSLYEIDVSGRAKCSPAIPVSKSHPTPLYSSGPWVGRPGLVYSSTGMDVAAAYKYHAFSNRLSGYDPDRYSDCEDHGGRVHTAEEMQAKFDERSEVRKDPSLKSRTKALLQSFDRYIKETDGRFKWSYEDFKQYLMSQRNFTEVLADAHVVSVRHKYKEYFAEGGSVPKAFPEDGLCPRRLRKVPSANDYHDIPEVLLKPTMKNVVGLFCDAGGLDEEAPSWDAIFVHSALWVYFAFHKKVGSLPCYHYDPERGLVLHLGMALVCAAMTNDMPYFKACLQRQAPIKNFEVFVALALYMGASKGHEAIVSHLLDLPNIPLADWHYFAGNTPLSEAAELGRLEMVKLLLPRLRSVLYHKNKQGRTALMMAAYNGHTDVVKTLLEAMVSSDPEDKVLDMWGALASARLKKRIDIIAELTRSVLDTYLTMLHHDEWALEKVSHDFRQHGITAAHVIGHIEGMDAEDPMKQHFMALFAAYPAEKLGQHDVLSAVFKKYHHEGVAAEGGGVGLAGETKEGYGHLLSFFRQRARTVATHARSLAKQL